MKFVPTNADLKPFSLELHDSVAGFTPITPILPDVIPFLLNSARRASPIFFPPASLSVANNLRDSKFAGESTYTIFTPAAAASLRAET